MALTLPRRLALGAALLLGALGAARARPAGAQELGLPIGTKAPAAAVQTLDGRPADLASYVGRGPVLIEFWATWCPNCKALEPQLQRIARTYAGRVRLVTVAVSVNQSPARVKAYQAKYRLPGDILWDAKGAATAAYDAPATSYVVLLDRAGTVVYTGQGGEQDLEAAVRKVVR